MITPGGLTQSSVQDQSLIRDSKWKSGSYFEETKADRPTHATKNHREFVPALLCNVRRALPHLPSDSENWREGAFFRVGARELRARFSGFPMVSLCHYSPHLEVVIQERLRNSSVFKMRNRAPEQSSTHEIRRGMCPAGLHFAHGVSKHRSLRNASGRTGQCGSTPVGLSGLDVRFIFA